VRGDEGEARGCVGYTPIVHSSIDERRQHSTSAEKGEQLLVAALCREVCSRDAVVGSREHVAACIGERAVVLVMQQCVAVIHCECGWWWVVGGGWVVVGGGWWGGGGGGRGGVVGERRRWR
jgi:hypothetical protein